GLLGSVRRLLGGVSVYAIGPRTAEAVRESLGVEVAGVPGEYRGLALAGLIASRGSRRVAGIRSPQALPDLPEALAERGVAFVDVYIYSTSIDLEALRAARGLGFDYLAATSPRIGEAMVEAGLQGTYIAIGPTTARALRLHGVEPACTAEPHTLRGVARCLEALESGASGPR
ncbi:MAG: uroporphyrinogen-III synthase, partial [Desulfurococcales archaeon]|nr:uroporphyrinogen-III synthase [Desulfurococcales archaeon]